MDGAESPCHLDQRRDRSCAVDQFWLLCEGTQRLSLYNAWPLSALNALVSLVLSICWYRNVSLEVLRQRVPWVPTSSQNLELPLLISLPPSFLLKVCLNYFSVPMTKDLEKSTWERGVGYLGSQGEVLVHHCKKGIAARASVPSHLLSEANKWWKLISCLLYSRGFHPHNGATYSAWVFPLQLT